MASKTNPQPCAKQDMNTQLMRIHDIMKARSQWNTQSVCHTAQDITWMHAADKNTNCMQQLSELETAHSHNETEHRAWVSEPWHESETQDKSAGNPNTTLQHETRHADERAHSSSTLKAAHLHKNRTEIETHIETGLCHKTHEWHQTEEQNRLTEPWQFVFRIYYIMLGLYYKPNT